MRSSLRWLVLVVASSAGAASVTLPAVSASTVWEGRIKAGAAGEASFDWPGVRVHVAAPAGATAVRATVRVPPPLAAQLRVYVNGAPAATLAVPGAAGEQVLTLVDGGSLPAAGAVISLYSILEPALLHPQPFLPAPPYAAVTLVSLAIDGAAAAPPPPPTPTRSLCFVGDSITAGFGAGGSGTDCPNPATFSEDHAVTYGERVCSSLGARCQTVAWSGKGLYVNSPTAGTNETMPSYYLSALGAGSPPGTADYDFAEHVDAVVINLGTK